MRQSRGGDGVLLTNGGKNIFHIRDAEGILWIVDAYWVGGSWRFIVSSVDRSFMWETGSQVVSLRFSDALTLFARSAS